MGSLLTPFKKTESSLYIINILIYVVILLCFSPVFALAGFHWQYDYFIIPILLATFYYLTRNFKNNVLNPLLFGVTLFLCGVVLAEIWGLGVSSHTMLAGKLPFVDARAYFEGAVRLLNGEKLSVWTSRRPLATSWLCFNMFIAGGNLKGALALMSLFCAAGLAFLVIQIRKSLGCASAWMMHVLLFFAYRPYIGTTLSEQAGFFFGCLAFALLWRNAWNEENTFFSFAVGFLILSIGLLARAGTFFILPTLVLWWVSNARPNSLMMLKRFLVTVVIVLLAYGSNQAILRFCGYPGAAFGNFSHTLYGIVHGGDWTQAENENPHISKLTEVEQNREIYRLAFERMKEQPASLLNGIIRGYKEFFISPIGAYSFITSSLVISTRDFHVFVDIYKNGFNGFKDFFTISIFLKLCYVACAVFWFVSASFMAVMGLLRLCREDTCYRKYILWAGLGILLSVPFIPPRDAPMMRVYIVSMPFFALLPSLVLARRNNDNKVGIFYKKAKFLNIIVLLPCVFIVLTPLFMQARSLSSKANIPESVSQNKEIVKIIPGSDLNDNKGKAFHMFLSQSDFIRKTLNYKGVLPEYGIPQNNSIGVAYIPGSGITKFVYWSDDLLIVPGEWIEVSVEEKTPSWSVLGNEISAF